MQKFMMHGDNDKDHAHQCKQFKYYCAKYPVKLHKAKVEAKYGLKNYCVTIRHALQEAELQGKLEDGDKESTKKAANDTLGWFDNKKHLGLPLSVLAALGCSRTPVGTTPDN